MSNYILGGLGSDRWLIGGLGYREALTAGIPATVIIDGVDVTQYVDARRAKLTNSINKAVDSFTFEIRDFDGALSASGFAPNELTVYLKDSAGNRLFGGTVKGVQNRTVVIDGNYRRVWDCSASDFTELLQRVLVTRTWENATDAEILVDAFTSYRPDVDTAQFVVSSGVVYSRFTANRITLVELIDRLAASSGFEWYVDPEQRLRYFPNATYHAPFAISDTPDDVATFGPIDFAYETDTKDLINSVTVVGGTKRSVDSTFTFAGDGAQTEFLLPYQMHAPEGMTSIQVEKNTGTDSVPVWGSALSVGIDNIDEFPDVDVLYNFSEKLLKFNVAPTNKTKAYRITGQYSVPIIVRRRSYASNDRYGGWYEGKVIDDAIKDDETAREVARSVLAENAFQKERIQFKTYEHGLKAGQTLQVTDSTKGIAGPFLIQSVSTRLDGADAIQYEVDAGEYNPDLINLLLDIRRRQFQEPAATAESVITELLVYADSLPLEETTGVRSTAGPYLWDTFQWGLMVWQ